MQRIIDNFTPRDAQLWGNHTVTLRHSLPSLELFSDATLATLIETLEPDQMTINTMAGSGYDNSTWHYCDRGSLSGRELLDAVRTGRIWINMFAMHQADQRFGEILDAMYGELEGHLPGFRTFRRKLGLLISSPKAQVFYHADVPGQGLWQIRGRKRIWIYPAAEPFLKPPEIENVVRRITEEDVTYEPWFDEYAEVYDLAPGDMLHWALNGPHRVVNYDCLNVSLTTEHWTPQVRRSFMMNYGNGILRSHFGWTPRSRALEGAAFWTKAGLSSAWRVSGLNKRTKFKPVMSYLVDPHAPGGVREAIAQ